MVKDPMGAEEGDFWLALNAGESGQEYSHEQVNQCIRTGRHLTLLLTFVSCRLFPTTSCLQTDLISEIPCDLCTNMVSVRKRKMARLSVRKNTRRVKDKQAKINIHSNPIIAANWDKSLTLQQNYKRLGLRSKLGNMAGGQEQDVVKARDRQDEAQVSVSDIENTTDPAKIPEGEARLIRDPETNEVTQVIYGTMKVKEEKKTPAVSSVVQQLEESARKNALVKKERKQSEQESQWLQKLYEKYGDDYEKMKWDKKLNVYQQSAGDLRRRITMWKKTLV